MLCNINTKIKITYCAIRGQLTTHNRVLHCLQNVESYVSTGALSHRMCLYTIAKILEISLFIKKYEKLEEDLILKVFVNGK